MNQQKAHEELMQDFSNFKIDYHKLHDLIKIFTYLYFNFTENKDYPDNDERLAKGCLYTIVMTIDELIKKGSKEIEQLYFDFE